MRNFMITLLILSILATVSFGLATQNTLDLDRSVSEVNTVSHHSVLQLDNSIGQVD